MSRGWIASARSVRRDRARRVAGLLVERAEKTQPREIAGVLVLELLDEDGELLVGAIDLGDGLVDLGAHGRLLPGDGEGVLERRERLFVLVRLGLRFPEVFERGRERAVVAGGGRDQILELALGPGVFAAREELATELALHVEARRLELHELLVKALRAGPVLRVEGERHQRAERLLLVGRRRLERERLFEARARRRGVAAILMRVSQGEHGARVVRLERDRALVRLHRVVDSPFDLVHARERHDRGVLRRARGPRALLEVGDEVLEAPVLLAIELREPLQRKGRARLREHHLRVAVDEHLRRLRRRVAAIRVRVAAVRVRVAAVRVRVRVVMMPPVRVEVLRQRALCDERDDERGGEVAEAKRHDGVA